MKSSAASFKHPNSVWEQVKFDIECQIIQGRLEVGERAPSINNLQEIYSISRGTAVKVLEQMFFDQTLAKKPKVGYFVKPFAQEMLRKKHLKILEDSVAEDAEQAMAVGLSESEYAQLFQAVVQQVYSRNSSSR